MMNGNLKTFGLAVLALAAFAAFGISGAQAAQFHCAVEPCRFTTEPDEAAGTKTAHHVYVLKNSIGESISLTCARVTGEGTSNAKTGESITFTNTQAHHCTDPIGRTVTIDFNGCSFQFNPTGGGNDTAGQTTVCPAGKEIESTIAGGCVIKVGPQTVQGVGYHNIGVTPNRRITVTANITGVKVTSMTGTIAQCGINPTKTPITSDYTTGNTIVKAETHAGVMVDGWWE